MPVNRPITTRVDIAATKRDPKPKRKRDRPHHVGGLKRADEITKAEREYKDNPRAAAKKLRELNVPASEIKKLHKETKGQRLAREQAEGRTRLARAQQKALRRNELKASRAIKAGLGPPRGFANRLVGDLVQAAVYTPAGIYQAGKAVGTDIKRTLPKTKGGPGIKHTKELGKQVGKQIAEDIRHPLRHPGYTLLDVAGAASLGAGGVARVGAAGRATGAKATAKALVKRPPAGRIKYKIGDLEVEAPASRNVARRQVQKARARRLNKQQGPALTRKVGSIVERQTHIEGQVARAPSELLEQRGKKLPKGGQTALRAKAEGKTIDERIAFHTAQLKQAKTRVERKDHIRQIRQLRQARKVENDPKVAKAYTQLKDVGSQREKILLDTGQMSKAGLASRKHAPGRVIETGKPIGKDAVPVKTKARQPGEGGLAEVERRHPDVALHAVERDYGIVLDMIRVPKELQGKGHASKALDDLVAYADSQGKPLALTPGLPDKAQGLSKAQLTAWYKRHGFRSNRGGKQDFRFRETLIRDPQPRAKAAADRDQPAPPQEFEGGEVYVPGYTSEPRLPGANMAAAGGPVIGRVRKIVSKTKPYTGEALLKGKVPENTTGLVARQTLRAVRYLQSDRFRLQVLRAAHDERRSDHDVLINDRTLANPALSPEARAVLGKETYTLDELSGHATAFEEFRRKLFPMKDPKDLAALSAEERLLAQAGGKVPGYKWVDERLLRSTNKPAKYAQTKASRAAVGLVDAINNASKMAILYLKPAYAVPNMGGNLFLNIVQQGFAAPRNLKQSVYLSHKIGEKATATLDSVMGEGIARAISSEGGAGQRAVNFAATKWSTVVDMPFRRASFIHEARQLGYKTPDRLRALLEEPKYADDLNEVAQRANDAIIDYMRLPKLGQNAIRRAIFFYPWVVGSTRYAGHFIGEHPAQAATLGGLAREGEERSGLGEVPSFLEGSFKAGDKFYNPASAGIFGTSAEVINAGRGVLAGNPTEAARLSQFATPALGLGLGLVTRENSLGIPYPPEAGLKDIAQGQLFNNLPQVATYRRAKALAEGEDQSRKLFPAENPWDVAGPFTVGGVGGRSYNEDVLHALAKRERRENMSRPQRLGEDYRTFTRELRDAMRKEGEASIPREVRNLVNLRQERASTRVRAHEEKGHALDARERFEADTSVIARHGWMSQAERRQALRWAKTASDTDLKKASLYLSSHYFDRDGLLSDSLSYLRDRGVDIKVPALPR